MQRTYTLFYPQKWTLSSQNIGLGSRIRDLESGKTLFRIPNQKGTGSRIRIRDTGCFFFFASIVLTLSLPTIFVIIILLPKVSQVKERSYNLNIGLPKGLKVEGVGSFVISGYSWSTKTRRLFKNFVPELNGQKRKFIYRLPVLYSVVGAEPLLQSLGELIRKLWPGLFSNLQENMFCKK